MSRRSYYMTRDAWWRKAIEGVQFVGLAVYYGLTWPLPTRWLSAALAPVGGLVALWYPGARRRAADNIGHVWPEMPAPEKRRLIREAGRSFTRLAVEYSRFERLPRRPDRVRVAEGAEVIREVVASGRGAVIVSAHFGNWEGIRIAAKEAGLEVGIIYRAFNNRYLDRYTMGLIGAAGEPVLQKGHKGNRQLVSHILKGGTMLILVDQRNTGAPLIPFLGRDCETSTAAAEIARRAKVPLIPAVSKRLSNAPELEVRFEAPVPDAPAEEMMAEVNRRIGAWVEACPEQWLWFHRRWKRKG